MPDMVVQCTNAQGWRILHVVAPFLTQVGACEMKEGRIALSFYLKNPIKDMPDVYDLVIQSMAD